MIYLNNAGTTWPKPDQVTESIVEFNQLSPDQWLDTFDEGQEVITSFLGIQDSSRFLFTQSCTQSLSVVFNDFPWEKGDRLIISMMEHHALSQWYYKLAERGVEGVIIPRSNDGPIDLSVLEKELQKGAKMVAMTMASNVTGEIFPYDKIVRLSKKYGATCLLDGAQTTGIIPISLNEIDPDIFVFAGHKGLFGPQGIGGLYISERVSMQCPSAACEIVPGRKKSSVFPSYCDIGSAPMMNIAGLTAGVKWLTRVGWDQILEKQNRLVQQMRNGLSDIEGIQIVGSKTNNRFTGAVSIVSTTIALGIIKETLWNRYQIKISLGFQCAPLAHDILGTNKTGTLRFSVSPLNSTGEVDVLLNAMHDIIHS